jgi:chromosome segregation ATPase
MGSTIWRKIGVYVLVGVPVVGLGGIAVIAQQQQDSQQQPATDPVADAARKARQQKKEEPKPKKVYTNEDFGSGSAAAAAATSTPGAATQPDGAAKDGGTGEKKADAGDATATPAADKNDEETWRKRFQEARQKLSDAEKELDILQREQDKAQVQYYSDPQKALSEQFSRKDINDHDAKIKAKKAEVDQLKQNINSLEDQLRAAGGDSGWSRP